MTVKNEKNMAWQDTGAYVNPLWTEKHFKNFVVFFLENQN
jgi:hypothetical protein